MRPADFVESYFDAWNHRDPQAVADHLAVNGIYCDVPEHSHHSHDQLIAHLREFFSGNPQQYRLIGDVVANEHTIAFQYEILPESEEICRGHRERPRGAEFITLHDDAASSIVDYYDVPEKKVPSDLAHLTSRANRARKYAKSGLTDEQLTAYRVRLDRIMQSKRLFLYPDMTLPRLAAAIDCSVNHLSQVINAGIGTSFFEYMNRHRVAYARELLTSPEGSRTPILTVAFTVGFNSNSAFYSAFKKCVGQTPAQYRKERCGRSGN